MRNHSNENEFDLHENGRAGETIFHVNGFARRLVLTLRQKVTQKWPFVGATWGRGGGNWGWTNIPSRIPLVVASCYVETKI